MQKVYDGHFSELSDHSREMDMQAPSMAEWLATERSGCKSRWHFTRLLSTETYAGLCWACTTGLLQFRTESSEGTQNPEWHTGRIYAVGQCWQVDDFYVSVNLKHCLKWGLERYKFSSRQGVFRLRNESHGSFHV